MSVKRPNNRLRPTRRSAPYGRAFRTIVFNYTAFRFEAWLAGSNREVQRQYWELFGDSQWPKYRIATPARGIDSIVECDLAKDFDFSDSEALTSRIETATVAFIDDIERFLAEHDPGEEVEPRS